MASQTGFTFAFNNAQQVIAIGAALPAVCMLAVCLRFYTRINQKLELGLDDWLILAGLTCIVGLGACLIDGAVGLGLGYPTPIGPASLTDFELFTYIDPYSILVLKIQFAFQIIVMLAYGFIKLSILAFYRRLFVTHRNSPFDITTKLSFVVGFLWTIAYILIDIFACGGHVTANWGSLEQQSLYCDVIGYTSEYGFVISDLILDFWVFFLPFPVIWKLHMTTGRKIAVSGIILLGASAVGASIARLVIYVEILNATTEGISLDTNLSITSTLWWSMLEAGLALIAACLPTLSGLFVHFSLQSAVNSVRSAMSLPSLRSAPRPSAWASEQKGEDPYTRIEANNSTGSHVKIFAPDNECSKSEFVMQDLSGEVRGRIFVRDEYSVREGEV